VSDKEVKKLGRPRKEKGVRKELRTIYISPECYEFYQRIGDGNFSKGVSDVFKRIEATEGKIVPR